MSAHFQSPLDQPVLITFFKNYAAKEKREEQCTLRSLSERILSTTAKDKVQLPWLKLAKFGDLRSEHDCLRNDNNVLKVSGIEVDYDAGVMSFDEAKELLQQRGIAACIYTSPSHTEDAPRWRVICLLSEELPPDKRKHMLGRLNGLFGGIFSGESWTLSQSYYFGSVNRNPSHRVELVDGLPIDLHDDLDEAWIGKPQTQSASNGSSGPQSGPIDVDALLREIREGKNYHAAIIRLAGYYAVNGKSYIEVRKIMRDAMEMAFPPDRDARWHSRYADIDRTLQYVFGKEAAKPQQEGHDSGTTNSTEPDQDDKGEAQASLRQLLLVGTWAARDISAPDQLLGDLITTTSRMFIVGRTGLGKTLFGLAAAIGMACGTGFLHWRSSRAASVLYIDGEMPGELIKTRAIDAIRRADIPPPDNLFIFGRDLEEEIGRLFPTLGKLEPLNTEAGQKYILALIAALGGIDVVVFDNVMSLITGDQKDEVPWSETLPLVASLTAKRIGQLWLDHTGHNTDRQYGSSTKSWRFDSVGIITPLPDDQREHHETAFTLSFEHPGKARRRTPENWADFETCIIRLRDDRWTSETASALGSKHQPGKLPPARQPFYQALVSAVSRSTVGKGETTLGTWELECLRRGLIDREPAAGAKETSQQRAARYRDFRKAKSDLLSANWIAIEDDRVIDLKGRWA